MKAGNEAQNAASLRRLCSDAGLTDDHIKALAIAGIDGPKFNLVASILRELGQSSKKEPARY